MAPLPTDIYPLSLHDALPIFDARRPVEELARMFSESKYSRIPIYTESIDRITGIVHVKDLFDVDDAGDPVEDRKSTRLNSSHTVISYAVFCLKKKTRAQARLA